MVMLQCRPNYNLHKSTTICIKSLLANIPRFEHISSLLWKDLNWLPKQNYIQFKIIMLICNCLTGYVPSHLRELCESFQFHFLTTDPFVLLCKVIQLSQRPELPQSSNKVSLQSVNLSRLSTHLSNKLLSLFLPLFHEHLKTIMFDCGPVLSGEQRLLEVSLKAVLYKFLIIVTIMIKNSLKASKAG